MEVLISLIFIMLSALAVRLYFVWRQPAAKDDIEDYYPLLELVAIDDIIKLNDWNYQVTLHYRDKYGSISRESIEVLDPVELFAKQQYAARRYWNR